MPKTVEDLPPDGEPFGPELDYPRLCGTMLLYAGVIRLEKEPVEPAPEKVDSEGPIFT
ncbi:hypothetical protein [Pseudomonas coronafaciens]|uniref:hypothetical protein n=1 Tax=Pseudomonas coronafaciens TaxID=53409 RepID=UPI0006E6F9AE|nr:hypothetical protein [Pseudomonas coronafaciens]KPW41022.1 Unknown protein sequence [Pseudomonas coronafaciens pv. atropurpurea]